MKNRYSIYKNLYGASACLLTACMVLTACDKEKEFTPAMSEAKLINSITFDVSATLPLAIGMDSTIVYSVEAPDDLEDRTIVWKSTDESIARVSQDGTITGVAEGTAVISATPPIGFGATASVKVEIVPEIIKATSLTLTNPREGEVIYETDKIQFEAQVLPADHTYSYLTWKSSDENIATVSSQGLVNCLKAGEVTISALTHDHSGVYGSYVLKVVEYIPVEHVAIEPYTDMICVSMGDIALDITYTPADATLGSVDWVSSDENVATVDLGIVTPKGFGTTVITATCRATGETASTTISVESGWWIWDTRNEFGEWTVQGQATNGPKIERKDGKLVVTLGSGSKRRADLRLPVNDKNPLYLDIATYPVFAMRCDIPKGGANTLDAVALSGVNIGGPKCNDGITLADGTRLIYYDIAALNKYDLGVIGFKTFQIKVADIPEANVTSDTYNVYWVRTFKSVAEMENFAEAEVAAGK